MAKRLGGWWRLWIGLSGVWLLILTVQTVRYWPKRDPFVVFDGPPGSAAVAESDRRDSTAVAEGRDALLRAGAVAWVVPCGGLLGLALLAGWVRRGFMSKGSPS